MAHGAWASFLTEYVRVTDYKVIQLEVHPLTPGKSHGSSKAEKIWFSDRHLQEILQLVKTVVFDRVNQPAKEATNSRAQILTGSTIRLGYAFKKKTEHQTCLILRDPGRFIPGDNSGTSDDSFEEVCAASKRYRNYQIHREKMVVYVLPLEDATSHGVKTLVDAMNDCKQPKVDISSYFIKSSQPKQTTSQENPLSSHPIGSKEANENQLRWVDEEAQKIPTSEKCEIEVTGDQTSCVLLDDDSEVDKFDKRKRLKKIIRKGSLELSKRKKGKQKMKQKMKRDSSNPVIQSESGDLRHIHVGPLSGGRIDKVANVRDVVDADNAERISETAGNRMYDRTDDRSAGTPQDPNMGTPDSRDTSEPSAGTSQAGNTDGISSVEFDINNAVAVLRLDKVPKSSKTTPSNSEPERRKEMVETTLGTVEGSDGMENNEEDINVIEDFEAACTLIDDPVSNENDDLEIVAVHVPTVSEEEEVYPKPRESGEKKMGSVAIEPANISQEDTLMSSLSSKNMSSKSNISTKGRKLAKIRETGVHCTEPSVTVKEKSKGRRKKLQIDSDSDESEWHFIRTCSKSSGNSQKENIDKHDRSYVDMTKGNLCSPTEQIPEVEANDNCHSVNARESPTFGKREKRKEANLRREVPEGNIVAHGSLRLNKSRKRKSSGSFESEKASFKKSEEKARKTLKLSKGKSYRRTNSAPKLFPPTGSASPVKKCSVQLEKLSDITLRNAINLPTSPPRCVNTVIGQNWQLPRRLSSRMSAVFATCETLPELAEIDSDVETELDCYLVEARSDAPMVQDEEAQLLWKSVHSVSKVSDLNSQELLFIIQQNEKYLRGIFQGKTGCKRHQDYKAGGKHRNNLTYQVHFGVFSDEQSELVMETLMSMFCRNHNKYLDYLMKVLLPEMLVKIYMDAYDVGQEEAESLMQEHMGMTGGM